MATESETIPLDVLMDSARKTYDGITGLLPKDDLYAGIPLWIRGWMLLDQIRDIEEWELEWRKRDTERAEMAYGKKRKPRK